MRYRQFPLIAARFTINTLHPAIAFTIHNKKSFEISEISKPIPGICTYLNVSYGDSKYSYQILECWHFWNFCDIFNLSSAHACRVESDRSIKTRRWFCFMFTSNWTTGLRNKFCIKHFLVLDGCEVEIVDFDLVFPASALDKITTTLYHHLWAWS